jgi:tetratricopeptide (TPR) repeat protein
MACLLGIFTLNSIVRSLYVVTNMQSLRVWHRARQFKEAVDSCTKAMELDGTNAKALYRRAHAHISSADLELGEADLARAIELDPSNYQIKGGKETFTVLFLLRL